MKFTLICFLEDPFTKTTLEFEAVTLEEVLLGVDQFLRGSSFMPQGDLQYIQGEEE